MASKIISYKDFLKTRHQLEESPVKMNFSDLFKENNGFYLHEFNVFLAKYNAIPNFIEEFNIDCKKANSWFFEKYRGEIKDLHYCKRYFHGSKQAELDDIFYFLFEDLMVFFNTNQSIVRFLFRETDVDKVENLVGEIKKFKSKRVSVVPEICLLINTRHGIDVKALTIARPKLSIDDNYNDDFKEIHQIILKRLSKKNDKGLVLLHGQPGTGKTSYIRYLITLLKKQVIFLPPSMAGAITNPDLISILIDNPNSIFVIEDAENIVVDREKDGHSPVSALLNISDGLLSDCLNIQVICTFNTDVSKIDAALMRQGRLIALYEFRDLEAEKARQLSAKLGFSTDIDKPMSLASIYSQGEKDFQQAKKKSAIGFKTVKIVE